ncbi:YndJ family protein [Sutcliffiella horikoshii]|uniref:YndJ family protein n=1 Tax=Sutcliffiella horikoshii TaxID=79883 RepID=UPI001CBC3D08|nr:YndJ family protein [Sutcliffiella horikoshii]UAL47921.1 YndJ family protein [Sutcliffiella horikoshii]
MKANLKQRLFSPISLAGMFFFLASSLFIAEPYLLMLTAAQLIFVPLMLQLLVEVKRKHIVFTLIAMLSVFLLNVVPSNAGQIVLAFLYLVFTFFLALTGIKRFFKRGFTNWAEISIDIGMMYLFVGGLWFFAYIAEIDTGFSPLITWLTAIHFHYSAFLFPVSLGFFGRLHTSKWYPFIVCSILAGPMLVAIGITFWPILEFISVLVCIFAIYSLIFLSFRTSFASKLQAILIRLSYSALGITIIFSLFYAANSAFGSWFVSIDFMLVFHGFFNCVVFGLLGVLGWVMAPSQTNQAVWDFPVSQIRGKLKGAGEPRPGLVGDLSDFVDVKCFPDTIVQFYEQTDRYQLVASVKWSTWFKPLAWCYKWISTQMQQLNLPISSKPTEMTYTIRAVDPELDGRKSPRAWIRKVENNTVFVAIYSQHETEGRTYMNIALPLPFSSMIGILQLDAVDGRLVLSSEGDGDSGIYLAVGKTIFKLPLSEYFIIREQSRGVLTAEHKMKIFGVPFLRVDYRIGEK